MTNNNLTVLGIETSCDETAVAIVRSNKQVLSHALLSQLKNHAAYGGVVPELAARAHLEALPKLLHKALDDVSLQLADIDAIAVTAGPGLIGGVLIGTIFAKALAAGLNKPIIAVNHLEGHALTARLTDNVEFPFLLLLLSGGHCQILLAKGVGDYELLGETLDDALGEAFDKVAKMMSLGYPGGPIIEKLALTNHSNAYTIDLPKPLIKDGTCNFSFSGLKTAVKRIVDKHDINDPLFIEAMAKAFQNTVIEILQQKLKNAISLSATNVKTVVIAGGVAANKAIYNSLKKITDAYDKKLVAPDISLCTDNAVMIAWAGIENLMQGNTSTLDFLPRSRWPLYK